MLNREGIARWLASFSDLVGIVVICEKRARKYRRIRNEINRVGIIRFAFDVLLFRLYYRLVLSKADANVEVDMLTKITELYPPIHKKIQIIEVSGPNLPEVETFISSNRPDIIVARCKMLINVSIFSIPKHGTYVMHPGICPEYRNSHGCFWALVNNEPELVGMTLLRIDSGVDTGPVFGYYTYKFNETIESYIIIQHKVVFENLDKLQQKFFEICSGIAKPLDVSGRSSNVWGQPWLSKYLLRKWLLKRILRNKL
jgi:hypothetical protein